MCHEDPVEPLKNIWKGGTVNCGELVQELETLHLSLSLTISTTAVEQ